ncbi:MAG TPA: hypothetical protein V6D17_18545, partial [Candidatus Obscuribacterales bacterium]
ALGNPFLDLAADRKGYLPILSSAYAGASTLVLALAGAFDKTPRWRLPLLVVLAAGIFASLGRHTGILTWVVGKLPFLGVCRYPVKLLILPIFCLALLAAWGAHLAIERRLSTACLKAISGGATGTLILGLIFIALGINWLLGGSAKLPVTAEALTAIGKAICLSSVTGLSIVVLLWLRQLDKLKQLPFSILVVLITTVDLFIASFRFPAFAQEAQFLTNAPYVLSYLQEKEDQSPSFDNKASKKKAFAGRLFCLYRDPLFAPAQVNQGNSLERTSKYFRYCRDLLVPNCNSDFGVYECFGYEGAEVAKYREVCFSFINSLNQGTANGGLSDEALAAFCHATAARWVTTQLKQGDVFIRTLDDRHFALIHESEEMNVRVYSVRAPAPRAYLADDWQFLNSQKEAIDALDSPRKAMFSPTLRPLVERRKELAEPRPARGEPLKYDMEPLLETPEHISISVKTNRPSCLVLSDQYYPGWRASVDAVDVPVYRANAFCRAIFLTPGAHLVEFNYRPRSLDIGMKLGLAGLAMLALLFARAVSPSIWKFLKWTAGQ